MINNTTAGASSSPPPPPPLPNSGLPPGYRFKPSDIEVMHHLIHKINTGVSQMPEIKDVDLYQYSPQTLARKYAPMGDDEWYFFSPTYRKHPKGKRPGRSAGNGFWRAMTAETQVIYGEQTVGQRLTLVYYTGTNKLGERTSWLMHEYRVKDVLHVPIHADDMMLADWVLCKIYKNARTVKANKRQKTEAITNSRAPAAEGYEDINDGDEDEDDYSRELTNHQQQGFLHHPQFPKQAAAKFNNGDADYSRALTNQRQGFLHHPQFPNQTMLFNPTAAAAAAEFNNRQHHHHHHNPLFDQTINPIYRLAAGGAKEYHNGGEGCSKMAEGNDMGAMFNPQNYHNPYLDQPSLFINPYANHHQAEGSHRVEKGKDPSYHPNLDQSSLPSSSNAGAQTQAQVGSEGLDNGGGKATTSNDQECYRSAQPLDQIQIPSDKNNNNAINVGSNIEGFSINGRGHCMINGERVEMGEDFMRTSMAAAAAPSPSNFNDTTDFPNFEYCSFFDDYDFNDFSYIF